MSNENLSPALTKPVSTALAAAIVAGTTKKYAGVTLNSSGQWDLPSAGGTIDAVLYSADVTVAGNRARGQTVGSGQVYVRAGATIAVGDDLKVDTAGGFIACVAGDVALGKRVAKCTEAGTVGSIASAILCGGSAVVVVAGTDVQSTAGAITVLSEETDLVIAGTMAFSLADGRTVGQRKRIEVTSATATPDGTLTITTPVPGESGAGVFKLGAVGQFLVLEWTATGWHVIEKHRAGAKTYVVGTAAPGNMVENIDLSVTGTVSGALQDGNVPGEIIHVSQSVASTSPIGTLTGKYRTKLGVLASVSTTGWTATTSFLYAVWDGVAWNEIASSGLTFN
jgi:hypothetical protein